MTHFKPYRLGVNCAEKIIICPIFVLAATVDERYDLPMLLGFLALFLLPCGFLLVYQLIGWAVDMKIRHRAIVEPDPEVDAESITQPTFHEFEDQP